MAFSVTDFSSHLSRRGVARPSLFEVRFNAPNSLSSRRETLESLKFRCDSASFPGRSAFSSDVKHYGPIRKQYYGYNAQAVTLSFILSESMVERDFFMSWQDTALGRVRRGGQKLGGFDIGYYDNYVADFVVRKFGESGEVKQESRFIDAFPSTITEVAASWGDDGLSRVSVTFDYHYFFETIKEPEVDEEIRNVDDRNNVDKTDFGIGSFDIDQFNDELLARRVVSGISS